MKKFKSLSKLSINDNEERLVKFWKDNDILNESIKNREGKENFVFYDGPAYANGFPGIHHILAKALKDITCKYKAMQGYKVDRVVGWDTHGLPTEVNVEKQLGFTDKKDIEAYGVEKFNEECKKNVRLNEGLFVEFTERMGQLIDTYNAYITFENDYIESEWWALKKFFDAGLVYHSYRVLPYCPRCGTELSTHEVSSEYKEVSVNSVILSFKLKGKDEYFLAWTTTPWTLLANVALCVNPNETYVKVNSKGNIHYLAKALGETVLGEEFEVLETFKGKDLEYIEYEQLMPFLKPEGKAFYVTCDEYVTMEDGTGIVHTAPAYGEDDYRVCKKYNIPMLSPVGLDGKYNSGPWKNRLVTDSALEEEIISWLKENNKLFKKIKLIHNYPFCWRCKSPLIYMAKDAWYIEVSKIRDDIVKANKKVNWFPSYIGEKRFGNWLENAQDWGISRNRYWGCPIPLWTCECDHLEMIGSIKELKEKAIEKIDESIDLHKPYVDNIHLKCPKCGKEMKRIPDVVDVWFDSGCVPFAQYHYPFENKEYFESHYPADFIAEGLDQTRGWFYTLIVINTFLFGESPYRNVLVNDLLLDKHGQKMHKSKGNAVEPFNVFKTYGADATRWYMLHTSPVWVPLKFDEDGVKEVNSKFFRTLRNTYTFFEMYANADKITINDFDAEYKDLEDIDKWLLSKYNNLIKEVTHYMDEYDFHKSVRLIQDFVCDNLSNWYIRRNRRRFWESDLTISKKSVYKTTYEVLLGLSKLIAPLSPFLSEEIYQNLTGNKSVFLEDYPKVNEKHINNALEEKMDLVIELISISRNLRETAKIKVRQPISEVIFEKKHEKLVSEFTSLIKEELNVKEVLWKEDLSKYIKVIYKPNFSEVGKLLGNKLGEFTNILNNLSLKEQKELDEESLVIKLGGEDFNVKSSYVLKETKALDGYVGITLNYKTVVLNTTLTEDLISEGLARELVSKIQNLRKTLDFDISDRIEIIYEADKELNKVIKENSDYIKEETLAIKLDEGKGRETFNINDKEIKVTISKIV